MRLENVSGHVLELRLVGYQYPDATSGDWDANWLIVEGHLAGPEGPWDFREPSLTTTEARELAAFIARLAERTAPAECDLTFTEPKSCVSLDNGRGNDIDASPLRIGSATSVGSTGHGVVGGRLSRLPADAR